MVQETRWKGMFAAVLAGGAVGVFLAPIITPALTRALRPATKTAIKAGMAIYQRGRTTAAELREAIEDVTAEIAAESRPEPAPGVAEVRPAAAGEEAGLSAASAAPTHAGMH